MKLESNYPNANITEAVYGVSLPTSGLAKSVAIDAATNDIAKYETVVRATAAIEQLDAAFLRFKPKALGDRPGPHAEVAAYAAVLQSMANLKRPELVALGTQLELDIEAAEAAELEKQAADAAQKTT